MHAPHYLTMKVAVDQLIDLVRSSPAEHPDDENREGVLLARSIGQAVAQTVITPKAGEEHDMDESKHRQNENELARAVILC